VRRAAIVMSWLLVLGACTSSVGAQLSTTVVRELHEPLPRLTGEDLDGEPLSTDDFAGRVLVINVWATWCLECETETPALVRLANAYAPRGVVFLGIDHGDQVALAQRFVERFAVPYPSFSDPAGRLAARLGYFTLPDTYVVDATGTIRYALNGATTEAQLGPLLEQVLAEPGAS
jgi:thiol-disulfide isomerase/thioredoxin